MALVQIPVVKSQTLRNRVPIIVGVIPAGGGRTPAQDPSEKPHAEDRIPTRGLCHSCQQIGEGVKKI